MFSNTPVVVQGTAVPNPNIAQTTTPANVYGGGGGFSSGFGGGGVHIEATATQRSEKKESSCNDPIFALLFYGCVGAVLAVAAMYGPDAFAAEEPDADGNKTFDYTGYVIATGIIVLISFLAAALSMAVMMCIPEFLIKVSLIFVTVLAGIWAVMALVTGNILGGVLGLFMFAIAVCYARAVWPRIPFATINLVTACTAIKKHKTVVIFSYFSAILAGGYSVAWGVAFFGVFDRSYQCDANNVCTNPNYGILFGLFLAFFFGHQVFQNSIHVCIAGTVGTWWFEPDDSRVGCCDTNVFNSFIRTVTTSFGSICFGSLLVAILQALKALAHSARDNGDAACLACIAECILGCLASILEYFNKWAFIYVGLYGMSYIKAGKSVFELFQNRGWEAIIADDLVGNTLLLMSLISGGVMGAIGLIINASSDLFDEAGGDSKVVSFFLGFLVGLVITSILMSTIASAVNTVIVCFAEAPSEFQQNHPTLSQKMREIWNQVYPGCI